MLIKRATSWYNNFQLAEYDLEPVHKRSRYPSLRRMNNINHNDDNNNNKLWGFDGLQSRHVMNLVSSELESELQNLEKQVLELEKAKALGEAEFHDTRKEYLQQFVNFWRDQEEKLTIKISEVGDRILCWTERLEEVSRSECDYETRLTINIYGQTAINLLEQCTKLKAALEFVKSDRGSLQEALANIESLSINSSKDQQNMDLNYLRRMYPRN